MEPLVAEVHLYGYLLGAVAEEGNGRISFQYAPDFAATAIEPSPLRLPTSETGALSFPELQRLEAFNGLPGLLADALPDTFGNAIIKQYFERKGQPDAAFSPVQRLLYIGRRAMGALEFSPPLLSDVSERSGEALELAQLVLESRQVIAGKLDTALPEIISVGASAGGMRAKAIVLWNPRTDRLKSAFAPREPGDEDWLIKFDGVGEFGNPNPASQPYPRIEAAYTEMASYAGIVVPETRLIELGGLTHFAIRRFDRTATGEKIHMHSLGGLLHADYNAPGTSSYEQAFRAMLDLGLDSSALNQWFRRMVFNVAGRNQDDHVKNVSFLMDRSGTWSLAPAYDLTFAVGRGYTRLHQMTIADKVEGITRDDLLSVAATYGVPRAEAAFDEVVQAVEGWPQFAAKCNVPGDVTAKIQAAQARSGLLRAVEATQDDGVEDLHLRPSM